MRNNILALIIIAIGFGSMVGKPTRGMLIGGLLILTAILGFVSVDAAALGQMGPAAGTIAFFGTLGAFALYRWWKKG